MENHLQFGIYGFTSHTICNELVSGVSLCYSNQIDMKCFYSNGVVPVLTSLVTVTEIIFSDGSPISINLELSALTLSADIF